MHIRYFFIVLALRGQCVSVFKCSIVTHRGELLCIAVFKIRLRALMTATLVPKIHAK